MIRLASQIAKRRILATAQQKLWLVRILASSTKVVAKSISQESVIMMLGAIWNDPKAFCSQLIVSKTKYLIEFLATKRVMFI